MNSGFIPIYVPTTWDESSMTRNTVMDSPATYTKWLIDIAKTLGYLEHLPDVTNNQYKLLTTDGFDYLWYNISNFPAAGPITGTEKILIDQLGDKQLTINDIKSFVSGGSSTANFVSKEIPLGLKNGINKVFNLSFLPVLKTEHVYLNGQLLDSGDDYLIVNNQITFYVAPEITSKIRISYFK